MKTETTDKCIALLFWAEWHEPCHQIKDMMTEMAKVHANIKFTWVRLSFTQFCTYYTYHNYYAYFSAILMKPKI